MTQIIGALVSMTYVAAVVAWHLVTTPRSAPRNGPPQRVVIVGGGFAGVFTARELERALVGRDDVDVVLVSRENYFVFQPMLPEIISGSIGLMDTVSPLRRLLPRTTVHVREVEAIDVARRVVRLAPGFHPHAHEVAFDHLVIAPGTVTDFRGLPGLPEHALPFKTLADALALRSRVIHALEEAAIETEDSELRRSLLTFVVAGGGFSGVEVVAELNDFVRDVARAYRNISPEDIRVALVHGTERILPEVSERLALYAQRLLVKRGVELHLKARLASASGDRAVLADGTVIPTKTLVSTIPSSPHPLVDALALPKGRAGKIETEGTLRVKGHTNLWALGDCALVPMPTGEPCPPTAQHATRQARTLARNLLATIDGSSLQPFTFKGLGKMGALGRRNAVAEIMGVQVSGFLAWFLWRTIYLAKLPGWGRRAKVAASWTFDLFLPPELVGLRLAQSEGAAHQRFEPGELVFREGDVGDRIYIVLAGAVEVVRSGRVLADIGPGEFFGEMALLESTPRNATVRCKEATTVLGIPKREFGLLAANVPGLRDTFAEVMRRRAGAHLQTEEGDTGLLSSRTPRASA